MSAEAVSESVVLTEISDRVGVVTLNRPEARNALSSEVIRLLPKAMAALDADPDVDVLILTGADPAFCAGLDLKELGSSGANLGTRPKRAGSDASAPGADADADPAPNRELPADAAQRRGPWGQLSKPVIGAINGVAITGGFELALGATSWSRPNGPASPTPTPASASCPAGG